LQNVRTWGRAVPTTYFFCAPLNLFYPALNHFNAPPRAGTHKKIQGSSAKLRWRTKKIQSAVATIESGARKIQGAAKKIQFDAAKLGARHSPIQASPCKLLGISVAADVRRRVLGQKSWEIHAFKHFATSPDVQSYGSFIQFRDARAGDRRER